MDTTDDRWTIFESPLTLRGGPNGLAALRFREGEPVVDEAGPDPDLFAAARAQLDEYFACAEWRSSWPLTSAARRSSAPSGSDCSPSPNARRCPTGRSPGRSGGRTAFATAAAVGRTPVPIIVPCRRVLAADGALTGHGGGLGRKRALLDREQRGAAGRDPARAPAPAERALGLS